MKKIGVLSDTHAYLHKNVFDFFKDCDEIWHAGDLGCIDVLTELQAITTVRAVFGNCDGWDVRGETAESLVFDCEQHRVAMMHIVGKPGNYSAAAQALIAREKPTILIAGHAHILRVLTDDRNNLLFINPGAAGKYGIHTHITFLRFKIDGKRIFDMEVYDEVK